MEAQFPSYRSVMLWSGELEGDVLTAAYQRSNTLNLVVTIHTTLTLISPHFAAPSSVWFPQQKMIISLRPSTGWSDKQELKTYTVFSSFTGFKRQI
jgi:hypothetical protein